jgi:hypothetical protein
VVSRADLKELHDTPRLARPVELDLDADWRVRRPRDCTELNLDPARKELLRPNGQLLQRAMISGLQVDPAVRTRWVGHSREGDERRHENE